MKFFALLILSKLSCLLSSGVCCSIWGTKGEYKFDVDVRLWKSLETLANIWEETDHNDPHARHSFLTCLGAQKAKVAIEFTQHSSIDVDVIVEYCVNSQEIQKLGRSEAFTIGFHLFCAKFVHYSASKEVKNPFYALHWTPTAQAWFYRKYFHFWSLHNHLLPLQFVVRKPMLCALICKDGVENYAVDDDFSILWQGIRLEPLDGSSDGSSVIEGALESSSAGRFKNLNLSAYENCIDSIFSCLKKRHGIYQIPDVKDTEEKENGESLSAKIKDPKLYQSNQNGPNKNAQQKKKYKRSNRPKKYRKKPKPVKKDDPPSSFQKSTVIDPPFKSLHKPKKSKVEVALQKLIDDAQDHAIAYPKTFITLRQVEDFCFLTFGEYSDYGFVNIGIPSFQFDAENVFVKIEGEEECRDMSKVVASMIDIFVREHGEMFVPLKVHNKESFILKVRYPYNGGYWHSLRKLIIWNLYYRGHSGLNLSDESILFLHQKEYPHLHLVFIDHLSFSEFAPLFQK